MEVHTYILRIGLDMQYACVYTFGDRCIHLYVVQHTHVPGQLSGSVCISQIIDGMCDTSKKRQVTT